MLPHMGNWVLDTERINIPCQLSVPAAAQPAALRAALEQLGRLQAPGARVLLGHNWQWTEVPGMHHSHTLSALILSVSWPGLLRSGSRQYCILTRKDNGMQPSQRKALQGHPAV